MDERTTRTPRAPLTRITRNHLMLARAAYRKDAAAFYAYTDVKPGHTYFWQYRRELLPSKAIVAVAFMFTPGASAALQSGEFTGGAASLEPVFRRAGLRLVKRVKDTEGHETFEPVRQRSRGPKAGEAVRK